jgi:hypothetical protein
MALNLLPLDQLGAIEIDGTVTFGLWLPWVSAADGNQGEDHPRERSIFAADPTQGISSYP